LLPAVFGLIARFQSSASLPGRFDSRPCSTKLNPPSMADCPSFSNARQTSEGRQVKVKKQALNR